MKFSNSSIFEMEIGSNQITGNFLMSNKDNIILNLGIQNDNNLKDMKNNFTPSLKLKN